MTAVEVPVLLLGLAVVGLFGWFFVHVFTQLRQTLRAIAELPGHLERAFDGSVPPWLRLVRVLMIMMVCGFAAFLIVRKFS